MLITACPEIIISRSGVLNDPKGALYYGARFTFDADVRELFPYLNARLKTARYFSKPLHIRFDYRMVRCTLYPTDGMAAPFSGKKQGSQFIGELIDFLNDTHDRRQSFKPNHKITQPPISIIDVIKTLPLTNCKKCGRPTCLAFAAALRMGEAFADDCPYFPDPIAKKEVYPVFGPGGEVVSTLSIEGRKSPKPVPGNEGNGDNRENGGTKGRKERFYDRFGLPIQNWLTKREIQVLRLLSDGASNPEISHELAISPHTVKSHVIHIFNKLNVNDRTQAAVWAVRNQVV